MTQGNLEDVAFIKGICDNFCSFIGFLGAKIVKPEQNLKTFWKSPKRNLTNNFVGNLTKYSWNTQIIRQILGCFWGENIVKTEYNFKKNSKYNKGNWTKSFFKKLTCILNKRNDFAWYRISFGDLW